MSPGPAAGPDLELLAAPNKNSDTGFSPIFFKLSSRSSGFPSGASPSLSSTSLCWMPACALGRIAVESRDDQPLILGQLQVVSKHIVGRGQAHPGPW